MLPSKRTKRKTEKALTCNFSSSTSTTVLLFYFWTDPQKTRVSLPHHLLFFSRTMEATEKNNTNEGNAEQIGVSHQNAPPFTHGSNRLPLFVVALCVLLSSVSMVNDNTDRRQSEFKHIDASKCNEDEQVDNARKPKWLEAFLNKTFFDSCTAHPLHKNELNIYCINCDLPACQYCASSSTHRKHKILKIYRLIYKDVVALAAMEDHIDCSQIQEIIISLVRLDCLSCETQEEQLYKCNRHLVIALKPLPHTGSVKWNKASSCDICSRKLAEPDLYRYCSISCKVEAVLRKPNDSVPPFISIQRPQEKKEETTEPRKRLNKEKKEETTEPRKRLNKEKKEEATEPPKQLNKEKEETTEPPKWLNKEKKEETTKPPKRLNKDSQNRLNKEKKEETTEPPKRLNKEKEETTEPPKRKNRRKGTPHRAPFF